MIPGKWARIDFGICDPSSCNAQTGFCVAVIACERNVLDQEEPFDPPWLLSANMCVGCGDCVRVCPLGAIEIERS